jgi:hypothetical protein
MERQFQIDQGTPENYSQEYLNIPIDETFAYFKRADFYPMREEDLGRPLRYYITADLAITKDDRADYSAFVVAGVDDQRGYTSLTYSENGWTPEKLWIVSSI